LNTGYDGKLDFDEFAERFEYYEEFWKFAAEWKYVKKTNKLEMRGERGGEKGKKDDNNRFCVCVMILQEKGVVGE